MHLPQSLSLALLVSSTVAAMKTSIFIDQIPGYSQLPVCAEGRLSAIVRAQSSGCGDNQQLTSFSCFCIDQSTMMVKIISTAVQASCMASMTATVSITTPLPQVTQALDVFNSYCARSTELSSYHDTAPSSQQVKSTAAPNSTPAIASSTFPPTFSSQSQDMPIIAIAAPIAFGIFAIAAVIGFFFWFRRRRDAQGSNTADTSPSFTFKSEGVYRPYADTRREMNETSVTRGTRGNIVKYRQELEGRDVG